VIRAHQPGSEPIDIPETIPDVLASRIDGNQRYIWMNNRRSVKPVGRLLVVFGSDREPGLSTGSAKRR
jgi:hypothetical protein